MLGRKRWRRYGSRDLEGKVAAWQCLPTRKRRRRRRRSSNGKIVVKSWRRYGQQSYTVYGTSW